MPDSTHTAVQAAAALGCPVGAVASSLIFLAGDEPLLVMTSGAHRVDTELLTGEIGVPVSVARAKLVKEVTGQPIGGVAPIGHTTRLRTIVDQSLQEYGELWAAGGSANTIFPLTYGELLRITDGTAMQVATD
jgi:prolyl-tRNA editing enzyme YbaK/EbsC (Cys-tRNA(Pro) deacylase)